MKHIPALLAAAVLASCVDGPKVPAPDPIPEPRALIIESSESHVVIHVLNTSDVHQQALYAHERALHGCDAYGKLPGYMTSNYTFCGEDHCPHVFRLEWHYACRVPVGGTTDRDGVTETGPRLFQ